MIPSYQDSMGWKQCRTNAGEPGMPRLVASPQAAATVAGAAFLLEPGRKLSQAETLDRIISEWREMKADSMTARA